jgi:hypothetical protein
MMEYKIYDDSKNYTTTVVTLPVKQPVEGLDNLVKVNIQGNDCLISKDSPELGLYLFFCSETKLSDKFLSANNLYRDSSKNKDKEKKGFFEDNGRVKAIKFKGIISSGFLIPINSLKNISDLEEMSYAGVYPGFEFNEILGVEICRKYIRKPERKKGMSNIPTKRIDEIVDQKFVPEHFDTSHLMKNLHHLQKNTRIVVNYKLHGTSARYYNTLTSRNLTWLEKIAKRFGVKVAEEDYNYVCASRRVIKSVGFEELPDKNHFYNSGDLWSRVGEEFIKDKLNKGEAIYCEIIGKTYNGENIQHGYSYGLDKPEVYVYRISNINAQGIEVDLSYEQMIERCKELNLKPCPEFFNGTVQEFIYKYSMTLMYRNEDVPELMEEIFYDKLLEKPSILDPTVVEEGFCVRIDTYPKPMIFKIKSKKFLIHEGVLNDKDISNIEDEQTNNS